jgi:hypothetical protein
VIAQSVLCWATGWTIGVLGFDSWRRLGIFLFTTASRTALGPTQPPIQWVPGVPSLEVKRPGREADHSPTSSAEVKNAWSYTSTPLYVFMAWCLVKHRDNCTFTFTFTFLLICLESFSPSSGRQKGDQESSKIAVQSYEILLHPPPRFLPSYLLITRK